MDNATAKELGALIDQLSDLKLVKADLERQVDAVSGQMKAVEQQIMQAMMDQNLDSASHGGLVVRPTEHTYAKAENWDAFYAYVRETGYFQLLERRLAVKSYREFLDLGRQVPGLVPTKVMKLSVSKVSSL
jgi:hypothetical protein